MQIPKSMNLWSDQNEHAGFMLISMPLGANIGECVFMLSPVSAEGIDSKMGIVVSELKALGEHTIEVTKQGEEVKFFISPSDLPTIEIVMNPEFEGQVFTTWEEKFTNIGSIGPVKQNA